MGRGLASPPHAPHSRRLHVERPDYHRKEVQTVARTTLFGSIMEAVESGWQLVPRQTPYVVEQYRGGTIIIMDTSGPSAYGYQFSLVAFAPPKYPETRWGKELGRFAHTETIGYRPRNPKDEWYRYSSMFHKEDFERGLQLARAAIDAHHDAKERGVPYPVFAGEDVIGWYGECPNCGVDVWIGKGQYWPKDTNPQEWPKERIAALCIWCQSYDREG